MIRAFLPSAFLAGGLGLAAAFVGPTLVAAPDGEPLRVAGPGDASVQPASLTEAGCARALLLSDTEHPLRLVALAIRHTDSGPEIALEEVTEGSKPPDRSLLLLLGPDGTVIAARSAGDLRSMPLSHAFRKDCEDAADGIADAI